MGIVYEAVRVDDAFEKRVAFKVVQALAASKFLPGEQAQAAILADLRAPQHRPDARRRSLEDGRLYLVMEYVEGTRIVAYADLHRPDRKRALDLFGRVCDAVEYAHRAT